MASIQIRTNDNTERVIAQVQSLTPRVRSAIVEATDDATDVLHRAAVGSIRKRTGVTASHIKKNFQRTLDGAKGEVYIDDPVGKFLAEGTGLYGPSRSSYPIVPRFRRALRWSEAGRVHFAARVEHPGIRGDDWLNRAAQTAEPEIRIIFKSRIERAVS